MKEVEKIFVDKMIKYLSRQFNRNVFSSETNMDIFQNVVNMNIRYVTPELKKHGIGYDNELYHDIVRGWIRNNYGNGKLALPGDRIRLIKMPNDPNPIEPGATGIVRKINSVDAFGEDHLVVEWDNPRGLNLIVGEDEFEVIEKA